jgi:DNA processing protein
MATAEIADSYNRIVMAVPGRITDSTSFGTNNLIRSGKARLIITANDIIEDMDWGDATINKSSSLDTTEELPDLKPQERVILDAFNDNSELDLDQLLNKSGYTIGELMMILMDLELKGLVRTLPGQKYEKI